MAKKKSAKKQTFVALVLDTSGSMSGVREATIAMFNEQRDTIHSTRKDGGRTRASLVLFGVGHGDVQVVHDNQKTGEIPRLTEKTYQPSGMTPMRDGIGKAITLLEGRDDKGKDTAFLVVVVTDGHENHSTEWTAKALSERVTELQNGGRWTFAVYGAEGLDLAELKERAGLGSVMGANIGTFVPTKDGMTVLSASVRGATASYFAGRAAGATASSTFVEEETTTPRPKPTAGG